MCGILAILIKNVDKEDLELVNKLFLESMIRGKHATGVSYIKNNNIVTISESISADNFIKKQDVSSWINEDGNLYCIGHTRYSTSDLEFNQPIGDNSISIVHNGVITQEQTENWKNIYNFDNVKTKNDSELVYQCYIYEKNPLIYFPNSSISVCVLHKEKRITFYRNNLRPLYYSSDDKIFVVTSTKDIAVRSNLTNINKTLMNNEYNIKTDSFYVIKHNIDKKDLQ